jgi:hypothetical protein
MSRPVLTRSRTRGRGLGPSTSTHSPYPEGPFDSGDEEDFISFTLGNRGQVSSSTPAARGRQKRGKRTADPIAEEGEGDATQPPNPPPPDPVPPPSPGAQGPPDSPDPPGPSDGDGSSDGFEDDEQHRARERRMLLQLTEAITDLARYTRAARQPLPPQEAPRRTKVREPDPFDGSDPRKLRTYFVLCELNFQDRPRAFDTDTAKVIYATSYLKGAALDWFEPDLLRGPHLHRALWRDDYSEFVSELAKNFGPHDVVADAEHQLANLSMKDGQRINKYIVEFNRNASQVRGYGEGALRHHFYYGLPDRIKDEISRVGKPASLYDLRDLAQSIDARYWERKSEVSRQVNPTTSSKSVERNVDKPSFKSTNPSTPTSTSSTFSGSKASKGKEPSDKPAPTSDLSSKLGRDGKLTKEERQRRFENKLCMFCGKPGHVAKDCNRASSRAAKARAVMAADPEADPVASDETKN